MQSLHRRNALLVAALAGFFWWAFEFAKHDPQLRNIIPFGDDPWDAVSSFAAISGILLALVSLLRSWFPRRMGAGAQSEYLLRTQAAVPICILVTVAAEAVAMARHSSSWLGKPGAQYLVLLQTALIVLSLTVLFLLPLKRWESDPLAWKAAATTLAAFLLLALYPESLIAGLPGHIFTVAAGAVCLFAPVAAVLRAWLPNSPSVETGSTLTLVRRLHTGLLPVVAIGCLVGLLAYLGEVSEDAVRPPVERILFVGGVFVCLGGSGLAIAYAFLGGLLGLSAVARNHG